jgi:hypothetical protein
MRHGSGIYFLPAESAEMLDWRGFWFVAGSIFFLFASAGGLTRKNVAVGQGRRADGAGFEKTVTGVRF